VILAFLLFATAVIRLHPDTPAARWLHVGLVERPLAALTRMERRHWLALVVLAGLCFAGAAGLTGELAWMLALDSSLYLDLLVAVGLASTLRTARSGWSGGANGGRTRHFDHQGPPASAAGASLCDSAAGRQRRGTDSTCRLRTLAGGADRHTVQELSAATSCALFIVERRSMPRSCAIS